MTKGQIFELLDLIDWDDEVYIETKDGILPICNANSGLVGGENVPITVLVLTPCQCDSEPTKEDIKLQELLLKQKPDEN